MNEKVLVTGAAGYIGSILVRRLLNKGYSVRAFDNLTSGDESLIGVYGLPNFQFQKGDIRNDGDVAAAFEGVHAVVHLTER